MDSLRRDHAMFATALDAIEPGAEARSDLLARIGRHLRRENLDDAVASLAEIRGRQSARLRAWIDDVAARHAAERLIQQLDALGAEASK
jgi:hypothetical protein